MKCEHARREEVSRTLGKKENGERIHIRKFRCRSCGATFTEQWSGERQLVCER